MKNVLIGVGIAAVLLAFFFGYVLLVSKPSATAPSTPANVFNVPNGTNDSGQTVTPTENGQGTIPVTAKDGSTVTVQDFTKTDQLPSASPTNGYQVAGDSQAGSGGQGYNIVYYPDQSYFSVAILDEPIGANRLAAENALRSKLGLSNAQLCALNISVTVLGSVNAQYGGTDVGLSFCPGSTKLPN